MNTTDTSAMSADDRGASVRPRFPLPLDCEDQQESARFNLLEAMVTRALAEEAELGQRGEHA